MTLLDRYIARQYVTNIVVLFVILFCFVVTIDVSVNIDRFIEIAAQRAQEGLGHDTLLRRAAISVFLIADLWWPRLLQLYNYMLGLVLVGAMGFTCTQMVRHRELVAVLASGRSLHRVARPIIAVAGVFILLQAVNQEMILPRLGDKLTRDHGDAGRRLLGAQRVPLIRDAGNRLFYARSFDADHALLKGLSIWERDEQGRVTRRIQSDEARWDGDAWILRDSRVLGDDSAPPPVRIETNLDPTALKMHRYAGYQQSLSWRQIHQMLSRAGLVEGAMKERLDRVRYGRISMMLASLISLVIAMPFYLTRVPRNMVIQSLKGAPVAIVTLLGAALSVSAIIPGLPAAVAVFIPVMVLLPIAIASLASLET